MISAVSEVVTSQVVAEEARWVWFIGLATVRKWHRRQSLRTMYSCRVTDDVIASDDAAKVINEMNESAAQTIAHGDVVDMQKEVALVADSTNHGGEGQGAG